MISRRTILQAGVGTALSAGLTGHGFAGNVTNIKLVMVGSSAVGKTCAMISYTTNAYPETYIPTVFDNYQIQLMHRDQPVVLHFWDTPGSEDYDSHRPLSYPDTDVIVIAYSVVDEDSLLDVETRWYPEVSQYAPDTPIVLVGMKNDLRDHPDLHTQERLVSSQAAEEIATNIGALGHVECSALTQARLDEAVGVSLDAALGLDDEPVVRRELLNRPLSREPVRRRPTSTTMRRPGSGGGNE